MRKKLLAWVMLSSMLISSFSNVNSMSVYASEYEDKQMTTNEEIVIDEESEEITADDSNEMVGEEVDETENPIETVSEVDNSSETVSETENDTVEEIAEKAIDEEKTIVNSGKYATWKWSLDDAGMLLVEGDITKPDNGWPWWDIKEDIKSAKVTGTGLGGINYMFSGCSSLSSLDCQ